MKEFVLMNENGMLGLGVRVNLFDNAHEVQLENLNGYSIRLELSDEFESWAIKSEEDQPYVLIFDRKMVEKNLKIIGEL